RVLPDLAPVARVDGEHRVGLGDVEDAVDQQRRATRVGEAGAGGLGAGTSDVRAGDHADLVHPRERQVADVRRVDLLQRAVVPPRIIAVKRRPTVGLGMHNGLGRERLRPCGGRRAQYDPRQCGRFHSGPHFNVARYAVRLCMSVSDSRVMMSMCACRGSVISTFGTPCSRAHVLVDPSARRITTSKSVTRTGAPLKLWPDGSVTVAKGVLVAAPRPKPPRPARGITKRSCSVATSYFPPTPLRSPDGEWHLLHPPPPLKYCSPALASPTSTSASR